VACLCLASDSGVLHPDSRGQSYPNVAGHHPAGRLLWVGNPPPEALQTAEACPDTSELEFRLDVLHTTQDAHIEVC
jgi:hypothetical protein